MKYAKFKATYEYKVEDSKRWEFLITELTSSDAPIDLEMICSKLGIVIENTLINKPAYTSLINDQWVIKTDKTNSHKVNRTAIASEIGHLIMHQEKLLAGVTFKVNYWADDINDSRFYIQAMQFANALLVEDEHFENEVNKIIAQNEAEQQATYTKVVNKALSDLYQVSETVINHKLTALGYTK